MKANISNVCKIVTIDITNGKVSFTKEKEIEWIRVSAKIKNKKLGITETLSDFVAPLDFLVSMKKDVKSVLVKKELNIINKLIKSYKKPILTQKIAIDIHNKINSLK